MIRLETGDAGRARVIGELTEDAVPVLMDALVDGARVLDLSQVDVVDAAAIRVLANLPACCRLEGCPRWLELWLEKERDGA